MSIEFSLFRIPVRIHLWFWLMALWLWTLNSDQGWAGLLIWVVVVFQGILMHELGHAIVGRAFGRQPRIELVALGGLTWWEQQEPMSPGRSLMVSAAGPAVGILIGSIALVLMDALRIPEPSLARYAFRSLIFVNLGWGILNLLPVLPLDGGNIVASLMEFVSPSRGRLLACYVSFAVIGLLFAVTVTFRQYPMTILLFLLAFSTYQAFRIERQRLSSPAGHAATPKSLVQQAFEALERGDGPGLIRAASELIAKADSTEELDEAFHLLAWGRLINGEPNLDVWAAKRRSCPRGRGPAGARQASRRRALPGTGLRARRRLRTGLLYSRIEREKYVISNVYKNCRLA
jgi:Zn-dependent protease